MLFAFTFQGGWLAISIGALLIGLIAGFITTKKIFEKQLRDNPPINENMIRAMFMQMGRKPSEAQIRAVMNSMKNKK